MKASEVVTRFIEQVNAQSTDGICRMMTEDHRFIDGLGSVAQGREQMRQGWAGYFSMVPDYWISSEEMIERDGVVAVFGTAGGTYCANGELLGENRWQVPAAWRAEVREDLVAEWRVYADNEPIRRLMARVSQ